jgi:hypothetical protein
MPTADARSRENPDVDCGEQIHVGATSALCCLGGRHDIGQRLKRQE